MSTPTTAVVIPTFGHFPYAAEAVRTAAAHTPGALVVVVDDGSPGWYGPDAEPLRLAAAKAGAAGAEVVLERFEHNGGLLRAWNRGLTVARQARAEFACVTNSDVLFTPGWDGPLRAAVTRHGYALAGPVTNAPGTEAAQDVARWLPAYTATDDDAALTAAAQCLAVTHRDRAVEGVLNGFCLFAAVDAWAAGAYEPAAAGGQQCFFRPRNDRDSKGRPNPSPLTTLGEYELQARWRAAGLKAAFCPGSFVFHYRSVTRGDAYRRGAWLRMQEAAP